MIKIEKLDNGTVLCLTMLPGGPLYSKQEAERLYRETFGKEPDDSKHSYRELEGTDFETLWQREKEKEIKTDERKHKSISR